MRGAFRKHDAPAAAVRHSVSLLVALSSLLIASCAEQSSELTEVRLYAMGTWVDLSIRDADTSSTHAALDEIRTFLTAFERDYYAWTPGQLRDLNDRIHAGDPVEVSTELAALLREAKRLSAVSEGFFEPGIGALVELWGFHSPLEAQEQPPLEEEIEGRLEAGTRIASLEIDGQRVFSDSEGLTLDMGGIAKGAAVDSIVGFLREHGIEHALINAGGDLRVIGRSGGREDERHWRVGIRHPREAGILGVVELETGEAAFTSGDYERFYDYAGERLHHILDPRTGYPVTHTQAVTVIADDGSTADAAATALFVAGPARWREIAGALGIEAVLRVDASGELEVTQRMQDRLTQAAGADPDIITPPDQDRPD